ncbi:tetratricopeptide repeat protein [Maribacter litopenaei]|uniref:Tetratricopeptide repeat protein n=1 Tax=Maribacter litopenaei TaxID=2976127 RepID=A0ABY5Y7Z9_9FLAO|nr:tetratricopeptide repeat protein [Maribacter litopenaei]UWX54819.1 tetratricopeptide repeat protein [Maribacter litopenaei]
MFKKLSILFGLLIGFLGNAQNEALFNQATEAYNSGEYEKAIEAYMSILEKNEHSAALYYNLGNAYYKLNEIPESIYYYEKSLLLNPDDQEVKTNLGYAQNMTLDAIDTLPQTGFSRLYKGITSKLTYDQWAYISIVCMILFVLLYIAFYYNQYSTKKRFAFIGSLIALFLCIVFIVFASIEMNAFNADNPAIIFADEVAVSSEPNESSDDIFTLHSGTKVNVLDSLNNYRKIRLSDGKTGWMLADELKILKDF